MKTWLLLGLLLLIFIVLNICDGHSTYLVVSNTSLKSEKNPVGRFFFKRFGLKKGIILLKSILLILLPALILNYKKFKLDIDISLSIAILIYCVVVINNYRIVWKIKKRKKQFNNFNI